ncbi:ATP-binding protein [Phytoactinopolyspora halotolerans]|uniref:ATP-binding protein n=1 Tax=Phytoactinopolyspora halotolerans TaxID=1981512 RepID=A0A6L9SHJ6_9ACTN|nr:ATP-binding protein [Phytoactinopolyspora halotolerans]NEE04603.1 ATP-binding protein [Phytoactinopolyspora halotolerans]
MIEQSTSVIPRRLVAVVQSRMEDEPVILLEGPRSVGKSTLLRGLADAHGVGVLDLDDPATQEAVSIDPATFMGEPAPVCVDEYQKAPLVLDAIKAELNRDGRPGRFLLTGSTRHDALPAAAQALTGRLHRIAIYPLSQGEITGMSEDLIDDLFKDPTNTVAAPVSTTSRDDYIQRIVQGGFPPALARRSPAARNRWFDDYIRLTLERDVHELARIQQAAVLPRLLSRLAGQTAQILNITRAANDVGLDDRTADGYTRLLERVFLIQRLPAWDKTLTSRTAASPKLHVIDSGVAARLLRLTPEKLARRDPTSMTEFGHLLETFVVGELQRQASWLDGITGLGHWRTRDEDEVDLIIERDDGAVIAFEVKASGRVPGEHLRPLRKLRDVIGDAFCAGVAFYLGERSYTYDDRIHVMPVDRLWS